MTVQKERKFHRYDKYRTHGDDGLCVIFKHANGEYRPSELTGHNEDHFKLPVSFLPYRVFNMLGKGDLDAKESWRALTSFDEQHKAMREKVKGFLDREDYSRHSREKLLWLQEKGLEKARTDFYAQVEEYGLGKIKRGKLVFVSYKEARDIARAAHQEKLDRIAARINPP